APAAPRRDTRSATRSMDWADWRQRAARLVYNTEHLFRSTMRTYKPTLALRLLIILFMLLPGIALVGVGLFTDTRAVPLAIGAPLLAAGAFLYWLAGRAELTVDQKGARRRGYFGAVTELRFDEITDYRSSSTAV